MATFTITTTVDFDSLTTKTGGDGYNINGGTLNYNTDTRWGKNTSATIGPTASIVVSTTLGGVCNIDGRDVWWLAFDTGAGVVPAAGDTLTGGTSGATGEIIGVWASLGVVPETAAGAMIATGFIKLKTKSGTFQDNEALAATGMTALVNSATGGVRGWLEIVGQESSTFQCGRLGQINILGDWFYLDDTDGTAGQIIQLPNGGGSNTYYPAVWIETGVGTNVYEAYPALSAVGSHNWTNTFMGTTAQCKFVEAMSSARVRIGSDGANDVGFVPASGCKVRIPNLLLNCCTSAARASNTVPHVTAGTRFDFNVTIGAPLVIDRCMGSWYFNFLQAYSLDLDYVAYFDTAVISEISQPVNLNEMIGSCYNWNDINTLTASYLFQGGTIHACKMARGFCAASSDNTISLISSEGVVFTDCHAFILDERVNTSLYPLSIQYCIDITLTDCYTYNGALYIVGSQNSVITDQTYCDNFVGGTLTTNAINAITLTSFCTNTTIDGVSLFPGVTNVHPRTAMISSTNGDRTYVRNIGTFASPIDGGSVNTMTQLFQSGGGNTNIYIDKCYGINLTTRFATVSNSDSKIKIQNCGGDYADTYINTGLNMQIKGLKENKTTASQAAVYGTHFIDHFTSDTAGEIVLTATEKTSDEPSASTYTIVAGAPNFTSNGGVVMEDLADEIIWTMPYYCIGHTAFQNVNPTIVGTTTTNLTLEYDIDVNDGSGFTGGWTAATGANLSAETVDPILGFKLKLRLTVNTAVTGTQMTRIDILTDCTTTSQQYLYPLTTENYTYILIGLDVGTEVVVFDSADTELDREVLAGTTYTYSYEWNSNDGDSTGNYVLIWKGDKQLIKLTSVTFGDENQSSSIVQDDDLIYSAGLTDTVTIDGANSLIIMDAAITEYKVRDVYSEWKEWVLVSNNAQYDFAFSIVGGDNITGLTTIPYYTYLENGWQIRPDEANHTLSVTGGILVVQGGGDPFVDTVGAYTVRINYEQPVQVITVSAGTLSAADVWTHAQALTVGKFLGLK